MDYFSDKEMNEYFYSLPAYIQESIMQSGVSFTNINDLHNCAEKFVDTPNENE